MGGERLNPGAGESPLMLADRFRTTAIALFAFAMTVLISRQIDTFNIQPEVLNIIHLVTVFMICLIIVVLVRAWIPKFQR